jgi:hypothetical protein
MAFFKKRGAPEIVINYRRKIYHSASAIFLAYTVYHLPKNLALKLTSWKILNYVFHFVYCKEIYLFLHETAGLSVILAQVMYLELLPPVLLFPVVLILHITSHLCMDWDTEGSLSTRIRRWRWNLSLAIKLDGLIRAC